ncbi:MAG: enoyl-CoA hydratase/isomerase family protein [Pseudomonadota bacterium]
MLQIKDHPDGIREIRLTRPPVNALNPELMGELLQTLQASVEAGTQAIVISGKPGLFSAGLDVPELLMLDANGMRAFWTDMFGVLEALARSPIPVATALTGHSPAGGTVIALFTDYRIQAAGNHKLGLNEVQVGLVVPPVIHRALVRLIGAYPAERHLVAGQMIGPDDALAIGLVDEVVAEDQVVTRAIEWCRFHLNLPRHSMQATRTICRADLAKLFDDPDALSLDAFVEGWFQPTTQASLHELVRNLKKAS